MSKASMVSAGYTGVFIRYGHGRSPRLRLWLRD
jgi:hypothetical protein